MSLLVGGLAGLSMINSFMGDRAAAKEADRMRAAEMFGAKKIYSATEDSVNIMKAANRESTQNAIQEALRVGMATNVQVKQDITKIASSQAASSEGLTSGRSKGRQMVSLYTKGNKALAESKAQTSSIINQLVDEQDRATNNLNNKLISAHQEMSTILTTPGAIHRSDPLGIINAGISGAASGFSLASAIG